MKSIAIKLFVLSLIISGFHTSVNAQWNPVSGLNTDDIKCVNAYDANLFYAGQNVSLIKSTNGGGNWTTSPILDLSGSPMAILAEIHDIHYVSSSTAFMAGVSSTSNQYVIYRTTNGGANWSAWYVSSTGSWPRIFNRMDFEAGQSTGVCVGTNGRIVNTTNGGNSWSQALSNTSNDVLDVCVIDATNAVAVGVNVILKSTDGGVNWTAQNFPTAWFTSVDFPSSQIGYATGENKVLYKTTDGGTTWNQLAVNFPGSPDFTSVHFINDTTGYFTAGNSVYKTQTGGLYWEEAELADQLNMVHFQSPITGLASGDLGQLYLNSNSGMPFDPVAYFEHSPTVSCNDSLITLTNYSDTTWTYEWLFNGNLFSTDYSTAITINNPAQTDTISLVATNGIYIDTFSVNVNIQESFEFPINATLSADTICKGDYTDVIISPSISGISYAVLNEYGTQIGSSVNGNGGTLTFNIGPLYTTDSLIVRATKTIPGCGSHSIDSSLLLHIDDPWNLQPHYFDPDTICVNESSFLLIPNSELNVNYYLLEDGVQVGLDQDGNGGTLSFPTNPIDTTTFYQLIGTSDYGCVTSYSLKRLYVEQAVFYTAMSNYNPEVGEVIHTINNTNPNGGSFSWDFDAGATPATSNAVNENNLSYSTTGTKNIQLIATGEYGCQDTAYMTVDVIPPVIPGSCEVTNYSSYYATMGTYITSVTRDKDGNIFTFYRQEQSPEHIVYSNNGDTLRNSFTFQVNFDKRNIVTKHSPSGVPMWSTFIHSYEAGDLGDIETDSSGNVYIAYYFDTFNKPVRVESIDGQDTTFIPPHNGSTQQSIVIVKYNNDGEYLWHNTMLDVYTLNRVSIKIDANQDVFVSGQLRVAKFDPNGNLLWDNTGFYADHEPDNNGGAFAVEATNLELHHFNANGVLDYISPSVNVISGIVSSNQMRMDDNGDLYITGNFRGEFVYGADTLVDIYTSGTSHEDLYLLKMKPTGEQVWIKHFKSDKAHGSMGMDVDADKILMFSQTAGDSLVFMGDTTFYMSNPRIFTFRCDTVGNIAELQPFYQTASTYIQNNYKSNDNVYLYNNGESFDLAFKFKDNFTAPGSVALTMYPATNHNSSAIYHGNASCIFTQSPSTTIPDANFAQSIYGGCEGSTIDFNDLSTNSPTSWSWSFPGGTPNATNIPNPQVVYATAGVYPVELTVTNAFGSDTYTSSVNISTQPSMAIGWATEACPGQTITVNMSPSTNYDSFLWSTGETVTVFQVNPYSDTTFYVVGQKGFCSDTAFHTITVYTLPTISYSFALDDTLCYQSGLVPLPIPTPSGGTYTSPTNSIVGGTDFDATDPPVNSYADIIYNYTDPSTNCAVKDTQTVFVDYCAPISDFTAIPSICLGDTLYLTDASTFNPTGWSWDLGGGFTSSDQDPFVVYDTAGVYDIQLTTSNSGGTGNTVSQTVTVNVPPTVSLGALLNDTLCHWDAIETLPTGTPTGGVYSDILGAVSSNTFDPGVANQNAWNLFTYTYTDGNGCTSFADDSIYVVFCIAPPVSSYTHNGDICFGDTLYFNDNSTGTPDTWSWDFDGGIGNSSAQNPVVTFTTPGTYTIELIASNAGGTGSVYQESITVNQLPTVSLDPFSNDTVCIYNSPVALPSGSPSGGTYTASQGTINGNNLDVTVTGQHYVYYTYTDLNGCTSSDTSLVMIDNCIGLKEDQLAGILVKTVIPGVLYDISLNYDQQLVKLLDASGKTIQLFNDDQQQVDLAELAPGVYFTVISSENRLFTIKLIRH